MRRFWKETALVGFFALAARLAWVAWAHGRFPAAADGIYYDTLARRLAHGDGYTWAWPDGAVTFVAHYPIGYPALLAAAYALFGASLNVAGVLNAAIGALAAVGAHRLLLSAAPRGRAYAGAIAVAVHPALVPYTSALMTEGITAALLIVAAAIAERARRSLAGGGSTYEPRAGSHGPASSDAPRARRSWVWLVLSGLVLGVATLVRPQCLLVAPALGALALPAGSGARVRGVGAAIVTCAALACCAPWTARNCAKMNRCALVSVNGGWNLLIGAQTASGAWAEIDVPPPCRTVWDEAGKDTCFERAARARIASAPGAWVAQFPRKLAVTFDYFGGAPWYLHASSPADFHDVDKVALGAVETLASRALLLSALVAAAALEGPRRLLRAAVAALAAALALTEHAWPAYLLLAALVAALGARSLARLPLVVPAAALVVLATALAHAVFFGAGRYGLVVVPFVTALAFVRSPAGRAAI